MQLVFVGDPGCCAPKPSDKAIQAVQCSGPEGFLKTPLLGCVQVLPPGARAYRAKPPGHAVRPCHAHRRLVIHIHRHVTGPTG